MSKTPSLRTTFNTLTKPAVDTLRTGIWLGEAAFNGLNKVVPVTKFGRGIIHFVDQNRLANYRQENATQAEKEMIIKEIEQRPHDLGLVDYLVHRYIHVSQKDARQKVKEAVSQLDPEVPIAEIAEVMEDKGVHPRTIEVAIEKTRELIPPLPDRLVVDLREPAAPAWPATDIPE